MACAATTTLATGTLLLGVPTVAVALPVGTSAPVVEVAGPVVAFYAGTAEVDGSTTLEPTTTGTRSRLDCTILFGKDSDVLRHGAKERLRRLADQLHAQGAGRVAITGYTDDLGSAAHGLDLSERRARRVAHELRQVLPAKRFPVSVRGLGEAHPAVPNTSEANRRKNRRVVVRLTRTPTAPRATSQSTPAPSPTPRPTPTAAATANATASPSSATASAATSTTPAAAPPPPAPPSSAAPTEPTPVPWSWIGGAGAALIAAGAVVDTLRRRHATAHLAEPGTTGGVGTEADPGAAMTGAPEPRSQPDPCPTPVHTGAVQGSLLGGQTAGVAPSTRTAAPLATDEVLTTATLTDKTAPESRVEAVLAADLAAWRSADTHRPRLNVLGPVQARTRGKALARRRPYYTELLAYLVLRPRGATVEEMAEDFGLTPARVRTDMKILRDWLGADQHTGSPYLPDARTTPAARRRGIAVYQLDGVLCDWHLFERLRTAAKDETAGRRNADLETALGLLTGRPFEQTRPGGWGWLFEGDRVDLHVTKTVVDVAVDLISYHRAHGDQPAADRVLETLAKTDPDKAKELASGVRS